MKVMLVNPVERNTIFFKLLPMRMPYLGIFQLARLTPDEFEVKLVDELVENYDYENDPFAPDLVGISASFTANALRAYEVADIYKKRGIPVVIGGVHATFMPEEAKQHADSVCLGEADEIWETILRDARHGDLKPFYRVESPPRPSQINLQTTQPYPQYPIHRRRSLIEKPSFNQKSGGREKRLQESRAV